ncbi:MAG: EthD family reductase [Anaerolineales bacterium]|nr:EthD family reductase [Anaerolineales bacterium]
MHKLVILIGALEDPAALDDEWPQFLRLSEAMPGLRREATSRVDTVLFGAGDTLLMHEMFFDSQSAARSAMASSEGRAAGRALQAMTGGRVTIFLADHKEDDLDNIRRHIVKGKDNDADPA